MYVRGYIYTNIPEGIYRVYIVGYVRFCLFDRRFVELLSVVAGCDEGSAEHDELRGPRCGDRDAHALLGCGLQLL